MGFWFSDEDVLRESIYLLYLGRVKCEEKSVISSVVLKYQGVL